MQASGPGFHRVVCYPLRVSQVVREAFLVEMAESWVVEFADARTQSLLSVTGRPSRQMYFWLLFFWYPDRRYP